MSEVWPWRKAPRRWFLPWVRPEFSWTLLIAVFECDWFGANRTIWMMILCMSWYVLPKPVRCIQNAREAIRGIVILRSWNYSWNVFFLTWRRNRCRWLDFLWWMCFFQSIRFMIRKEKMVLTHVLKISRSGSRSWLLWKGFLKDCVCKKNPSTDKIYGNFFKARF